MELGDDYASYAQAVRQGYYNVQYESLHLRRTLAAKPLPKVRLRAASLLRKLHRALGFRRCCCCCGCYRRLLLHHALSTQCASLLTTLCTTLYHVIRSVVVAAFTVSCVSLSSFVAAAPLVAAEADACSRAPRTGCRKRCYSCCNSCCCFYRCLFSRVPATAAAAATGGASSTRSAHV